MLRSRPRSQCRLHCTHSPVRGRPENAPQRAHPQSRRGIWLPMPGDSSHWRRQTRNPGNTCTSAAPAASACLLRQIRPHEPVQTGVQAFRRMEHTDRYTDFHDRHRLFSQRIRLPTPYPGRVGSSAASDWTIQSRPSGTQEPARRL